MERAAEVPAKRKGTGGEPGIKQPGELLRTPRIISKELAAVDSLEEQLKKSYPGDPVLQKISKDIQRRRRQKAKIGQLP